MNYVNLHLLRIAVACSVTWWLGAGTLARAQDLTRDEPTQLSTVYYDYASEDGTLSGGRIELPVTVPGTGTFALRGDVTTLLNSGPPANRIDIVLVGDGYTLADLGVYAQQVNSWLAGFLAAEPFHSYSHHFNVHRVDVISTDSGVDHDPTYPIWRDTALDMGFFCGEWERLLCVDVAKAYSYANSAPGVDAVLAVANSTKYGGAGYVSENLATFAGGNIWATDIALHESGHSLAGLADEYDYGDGLRYTGSEPVEPNVSILTATQMAAAGTKWSRWLGVDNASYDGLQSTYEGAYYCQYGIYRPSNNSKMRLLGRPYNLPTAEALVIAIYKLVHPIDAATPNSSPLSERDTITVTLVQPVGHSLSVQWYLDGQALSGATGTSLDLSTLGLARGVHAASVAVLDPTNLVRDEAARQQWLREARQWTVSVGQRLGDMNCDGVVDFDDISPFVKALLGQAAYEAKYPGCNWLNGDYTNDGVVDFGDINPFVAALARQR
jgi:hypothetical protein